MLDDYTRFQANDEIALLHAISMTEVTAKKAELYNSAFLAVTSVMEMA